MTYRTGGIAWVVFAEVEIGRVEAPDREQAVALAHATYGAGVLRVQSLVSHRLGIEETPRGGAEDEDI